MRLFARGFTLEELADLTRPHLIGWSGSEQQYWLAQAARFEHLLESDSPTMKNLAKRILGSLTRHAERAARRERHEAVYGLDKNFSS